MITISQLKIQYGGREILNDITFQINPKDRIGIVGKNGSGKTTLFRVIAKEIKPDSGEVINPDESSIGYLPQEMIVRDNTSVYDETCKAFSKIIKLDKEIEKINLQISERTDYESNIYQKLIDKLTELNERRLILGGDNRDAEIEQTLFGLGFLRKDFKRLTSEFSGGWRMRIELAKIILQKPKLLLLDEPTNHLDIESIRWLEKFLKTYNGAVLLVSHDRAFLDNITNRTIEISLGIIYDYRMSFSKFENVREERREQQVAAFNNQQKMISDTEKFIERFRYKNTKAVQVQSRIKQLEKLDIIEIEEEDTSAINIRFPSAPRSGREVYRAKNLTKKFNDLLVFDKIDLVVERGEKIAFVGKNGEGKTTLSKIIVNELDYSGESKMGQNVEFGYFAQNQDELLDGEKTVFSTIDDIAVGDIRSKIRDILGAFLFSGDDVDKKVKVLSGGEKSRLAIAMLLLKPINLLVLDEPTNHLDMRSKDILKQALKKYNGTLILVSHDREFLDGIIDKVYEFKNNRIYEHIGGIYDFLYKKDIDELKELETSSKQITSSANKKLTENKKQHLERKEIDKKIRKLNNQIKKIEQNIEKIELEIEGYESIISHPEQNKEKLKDKDFYKNYEELKKKLNDNMWLWEELHSRLELFKKK